MPDRVAAAKILLFRPDNVSAELTGVMESPARPAIPTEGRGE